MRPTLRRAVAIAAMLSAAMLGACLWHDTAARATPRPVQITADPPATTPANVAPPPELPRFDTGEPSLLLDDPPLPPKRLAGKVLFEEGRPVPRACVFDLFGSVEGSAETAEDGSFVLELEPGTYLLAARSDAAGYSGGCARAIVPEHGIVPDVTITLARVRHFWATVRVVEADGRAAVNVQVVDQRTDALGRARLCFANDAGPRDLTLDEDGLVGVAGKATVEVGDYDPGPETVVELPPLRSVRIVITGPGGAPVPPALIRSVAAGVGNGALDLPPVDGGHRLAYRRWPDGGVRLYVAAEGFAFWMGGLRKPSEQAEVRLELPATIVGRLLDENGDPAAGQELSCYGSATTDAEGRFQFEGLISGRENEIRVFRRPEKSGSYSFLVKLPVKVAAGEIRDVGDLKLPRLAPTRGRVVDLDGGPVAGATVEARGGPLRFGGEAESGADGEFQLELPASQRWDLRVKRRGYCTVVAEDYEAGADAPVELVLPPEGRVRVHTTRSYGGAWAQVGEHRIDLECRKGQLIGLPAGPVRVHLVESGEVVSAREVDVVPGRIVDVDFP